MQFARFKLAALALVGGVSLAGCAYDMYGDPYGNGYGYAPYGGVSVGVGYGGYGGYGYGYPYYGYGYGYDPFGWYGDYYYPGTGIYVYDRHHNRHQWSDDQRRYWENRRSNWQSHHSGSTSSGENWSGWRNRHGSTSTSAGTVTSSGTVTSGDRRGGYWHGRSSSTSTTTTTTGHHDWSGGRHSRESSDERPQ